VNAFATALRALMADANIASDATLRALGQGAPVAIRAVLSRPDVADTNFAGDVIRLDPTLSVAIADYPHPARGDTVTINDETFTVKAWEADAERLSWTVTVR
jgi:hypothetical protein